MTIVQQTSTMTLLSSRGHPLPPRSATPARITLGVTTVLTLCTLMAKADASLPSTAYPKVGVSYILAQYILAQHILAQHTLAQNILAQHILAPVLSCQAVEIYLWVCFIFTFAALVEFRCVAPEYTKLW